MAGSNGGMRHITSAIAIGSVVGALGLGGLAYASTTGSAPAAPATKAKTTTSTQPKSAKLLHRSIYAQVIVEGKGHTTHTITYERGKFTGISAGALHLTRPDGVQVSAPITTTTKFRRITQASLVSGDLVRIIERDGATTTVIGHAPKTAPVPKAAPAGVTATG